MNSRSQQLKKTDYADDAEFGTPLKHKNLQRTGLKKLDLSEQETTVNHENKLPVNLFYSAAEYNKMLITNGKSIKKKSEPIIQGFISNLQFINDPIFQSCEERRQSMRHRPKPYIQQSSDRKKVNSLTQDCCCCCCDQYCKICASEQSKGHHHHPGSKNAHKLSQYQLEKALQKVNSKPLKATKNKNKNQKKVITSEAQIRMIDKTKQIQNVKKQSKGAENSEKQCSSSYLSHKSFNVQKLIGKTLAKFQSQKRQNQLNKLMEKKAKMEHEHFMKQFGQQIREHNRKSVSRSKSKAEGKNQRSKSNKNNIRFEYWQSIQGTIAQSLQNDKVQGLSIKAKSLDKLANSVACEHKIELSPQQINALRIIHGKQAKEKIAKQVKQKQVRKKKLQNNLNELEKYRKQHIKSCQKRKFKPTQEMIESAFQNIVQEDDKKQISPQNNHKGQKNSKRDIRKTKI